MSPETPALSALATAVAPPSYTTAWLLSSALGIIGADRFYTGRVWTGVFKALTLGGFGLWAYVDVFLIAFGMLRTREGAYLGGYEEHKKSVQVWTIIGMVVVPILIFIAISIASTILLPKLLDGLQGVQLPNSSGGLGGQQDILNSL